MVEGSLPPRPKRPTQRIVTPEQYAEGYLQQRGVLVERHPWRLIKELDDGNYLVVEPGTNGL